MAREEWKLSEPPRSTTDVARLDAERAGVGGDVGPGLVDHADDADRHAHAADHQAVGPRPFARSRRRPDRAGRRCRRGPWPSPRRARRSSSRRSCSARISCRRPWRPSMSLALAARIAAFSARIRRAASASARFLASVEALRRATAAAWRAGPAPRRGRRRLRQAWSERSSAAPV